MRALAFADRVEVLVLVDNVTDNLSTAPNLGERVSILEKGGRILSGQCLFALHGLSCAITAGWRYRQDAPV
jgi:7,8-dihydropterin-6-yl-methyl-4-(beta-D-ribofuranosyl)aminobenzene 5'-phosphate synthase